MPYEITTETINGKETEIIQIITTAAHVVSLDADKENQCDYVGKALFCLAKLIFEANGYKQ